MTKSQPPTQPAPSTTSLPLVSAAIAAKVTGLGPRQFARLVALGVLPRAAPKLFDLLKVGPAFAQYLRDGKEASSEVAAARLAYLQSQRKALDQRTRARAKELVELQDVTRTFSGACTLLAGQLDAGAGRLLSAVIAVAEVKETERAKLHEVLRNEFRRIRESTAAALLTFGGDHHRGEAAATPASTNGSGVGACE